MVHKRFKSRHEKAYASILERFKGLGELKIVKALQKEGKENRAWMNKQFHKLPHTLQIALASPRDALFVEKIYPLYPKGEVELEKKGIRYGLVGFHKKSIYIGNIKPVGKNKANVSIRKVFP